MRFSQQGRPRDSFAISCMFRGLREVANCFQLRNFTLKGAEGAGWNELERKTKMGLTEDTHHQSSGVL